MYHSEFIEKMARYKPVYETYKSSQDRAIDYKELGLLYGMSPTQAWFAVDYYDRHKSDPQIEAFTKETHATVMNLYPVVRLDSLKTIREDLCNKFKAKNTNEGINHKHSAPRRDMLIIMKASGLPWFELNGTPFIHWDAKP